MVAQGSSKSQADVRTFQAAHNAFRLATTRIADATEKLEPSALQRVIQSHWSFYAAVLHHHHHSEDDSIFPALLAARPDMEPLIKRMENDHHQLILTMETVDSMISAFAEQPDKALQQSLHQAVAAVRAEFFPHLVIEDEQVLPAIADSINPTEWARLDSATLKSIPRKYLPTAVGAIDEIISGLPKDKQPPPAPVLIRLMLALSWRRKWSTWVKALAT